MNTQDSALLSPSHQTLWHFQLEALPPPTLSPLAILHSGYGYVTFLPPPGTYSSPAFSLIRKQKILCLFLSLYIFRQWLPVVIVSALMRAKEGKPALRHQGDNTGRWGIHWRQHPTAVSPAWPPKLVALFWGLTWYLAGRIHEMGSSFTVALWETEAERSTLAAEVYAWNLPQVL
jgi:hypothetical protein